jgi:predicted XRE-type DNA-binding protein
MAKRIKRTKKVKLEKIEYEVSSGNVFTDFGFPYPEEADAKSDLAILICSIIKQRKLTQKQAAKLMKIDQPKVSKIMRGLLSEFTIERLMKYLLSLGFDIEIKPTPSKAVIPSIHIIKSNTFKRLNI